MKRITIILSLVIISLSSYSQTIEEHLTDISGSKTYSVIGGNDPRIFINTGINSNVTLTITYNTHSTFADIGVYEYPSMTNIGHYSGVNTQTIVTTNSTGQVYVKLTNTYYTPANVTIEWQAASSGDYFATEHNFYVESTKKITISNISTSFYDEDEVEYVHFDGNTKKVGIGTTSPDVELQVEGKLALGSYANNTYPGKLLVKGNGADNGITVWNQTSGVSTLRLWADTNSNLGFLTRGDNKDNGIAIAENGHVVIGHDETTIHPHRLTVGGTAGFADGVAIGSLWSNVPSNGLFVEGAVGIGTNNVRNYELAVNGEIIATEIVVKATPWPDYVFEKDYSLPKISEVENFIKENKHLPNVPTADKINNDGVSVGEMNRILLQKIEELTLYIIDMEKRIKELEGKDNQ